MTNLFTIFRQVYLANLKDKAFAGLLAFYLAAPIGAQGVVLVDLMEQAVYEQQTADNPQKAIELYQQIITDENASREMLAQALYNTGLCYQKLDKKLEAKQAFSAVVTQYKDIDPYYQLADRQINPVFEPTPATWPDGERLEFEIRSNNLDKVAGYYWTSTFKLDWNGTPALKLQNRAMSNNGMSMIVVDEKTSRPLYSEAINPNLKTRLTTATWTDSTLIVSTEGDAETKTFPIEGNVYDGEQQFWLMRQLPLEVGRKVQMKVQSILVSKAPQPNEYEVVAEELLEVPAGTFDSYKVSHANGLLSFWIDKGPEHRLLKLQGPTSYFQLVKIQHVTPGAWRTITSDSPRFSVEIPDEWFAVKSMDEEKHPVSKTVAGATEGSRLTIQRERHLIRDDAGKLNIQLLITDISPLQAYNDQDLTLAGRVAFYNEQMSKSVDNFAVREGSQRDLSINGLAAYTETAEYTKRGEPWIYYSTYIMDGTRLMWFGAHTQAVYFDEGKTMFDHILHTIKTY